MLPYLTALFVLVWRWNGVGGRCVLKATTKKGRQLFWGKKCIRVTWLEDFLTSKWPGSFTALAPPLPYGPTSTWGQVHSFAIHQPKQCSVRDMLIYVIMVKTLRKKQTPDFWPSSETLLWPSGWHFVVATEAGRVLILLLFFCIDSRSSFCRCLRVAHTHFSRLRFGFCTRHCNFFF